MKPRDAKPAGVHVNQARKHHASDVEPRALTGGEAGWHVRCLVSGIPIACRRNQDRLSARLSAGVEGSPGHHRRYVEGSKPIASTDCSVGRRPRSDPTNTQGKVARRIVGRNVEPPQYCLMMPRRTCTPVAAQQMLTEQHSKCSRNLRSCQQPAYLMPSARSECVRGRCHLRGPILNRCRPIQRPE